MTKKDTLGPYLETLEKADLIALVQEAAGEDVRLRQRLELQAAMHQQSRPDRTTLRRALSSALSVRDSLSYSKMRSWVRAAYGALNQVESLLPQHPDLTIDLTEYALQRLEAALGKIGGSSGVGDLLRETQTLHLKACRAARPDPVALARRLQEWEKKSEWNVFRGAAQTYADVLGDAGLAEYQRLLEIEWGELPALDPSDPEVFTSYFRLTHAMEALAKARGDVDALIAVKSKNLSSPHYFLQIAEVLSEAGRGDEALDWAERGWSAFPKPDLRLGEFLIAGYRNCGRHEAALDVAWQCFEHQPSAHTASRVTSTAEPANLPEVHTRLVEALHPRPTELVRFLLREGDTEDAWATAQARGCDEYLWVELAERRAQTHPQESLAVWQRILENDLDSRTSHHGEVIERIEGLRKWMEPDAFTAYVAHLRTVFKRKRNFLRDLDARGL